MAFVRVGREPPISLKARLHMQATKPAIRVEALRSMRRIANRVMEPMARADGPPAQSSMLLTYHSSAINIFARSQSSDAQTCTILTGSNIRPDSRSNRIKYPMWSRGSCPGVLQFPPRSLQVDRTLSWINHLKRLRDAPFSLASDWLSTLSLWLSS